MTDRLERITIAVVARDAEATIERAVASALEAGPCPILLVDDGSTDRTVARAKALAGGRLTVTAGGGDCVGRARQIALEQIETPYGMWLDADDAILPSRPASLLAALEDSGADLVYDSAELVDGATGELIGRLDIPEFVADPAFAIRNAERNWYPSLHAGFRTAFARILGMDTSFECAEDYDFLLRAIMAGATITNLNTASYHYSHHEGTISRDVGKTRHFVARALMKHSPGDIARKIDAAGISATEKACILAGSALYRGAPDEALAELNTVAPTGDDISPQYGVPFKWLVTYLRASALYQKADWAVAKEILEQLGDAPEVLNNRGVCARALGAEEQAISLFERAVAHKAGYRDALLNLKDGGQHFTTHPFRRQFSRDRY